MSTDAIVVLKAGPHKVRKLFREFQQAGEDERPRKGELAKKIIEQLTAHTYIENEVMYPRGARATARTSRKTFWSPTRSTTWPTYLVSSSGRCHRGRALRRRR